MIEDLALDDLKERIVSHYAILLLVTWEETRWQAAVRELARQTGLGLATWSATEGLLPAPVGVETELTDPLELLDYIAGYESEFLFLIKDFHPYLRDARVVRRMRDLAPILHRQSKTLLLMGPDGFVPLELRKDAVCVDLPLPDLEELRAELHAILAERASVHKQSLSMDPDQEERLIKAVLGLTQTQARKALGRALFDHDRIDGAVYECLVAEKRRMIQGSDLLEFQELQEGVDDVGGLEALKDWIGKRAEAFTERARKRGIPAPKGVLLLGVQGCGKSLVARAVARLLSFPLVRLDVATLLSADTGSSEQNMRDVLELMETIAPAVLWLDEIEKGFAGAESEGASDAIMTRLMGRFLTWMQEHSQPVFVVATANAVNNLPPEMLRRGRFDELFFVDLPNYHERKDIFAIHLKRRGLRPDQLDLNGLAERTEGYSGAEIEQVVLSAMVETFDRNCQLTHSELKSACDEMVPLSVTMEERIFALREWARGRCRPATPDSRVLQILEAEQRENGLSPDADFDEPAPEPEPDDREWRALAECGELTNALLEFIRHREQTIFRDIQRSFAELGYGAGDHGLALRADPNIVVCVGLCNDLASALAKAINDRRVYLHPAPVPMYGSISRGVRLPLLQSLTDRRQPRPFLLPVCLSGRPPESPDKRLQRVARMKLNKEV